jgi:hypothetical protein
MKCTPPAVDRATNNAICVGLEVSLRELSQTNSHTKIAAGSSNAPQSVVDLFGSSFGVLYCFSRKPEFRPGCLREHCAAYFAADLSIEGE